MFKVGLAFDIVDEERSCFKELHGALFEERERVEELDTSEKVLLGLGVLVVLLLLHQT